MKAIVTVCNKLYQPLLILWLERIRKLTAIPIFILILDDFKIDSALDYNIIKVSHQGNPFFTNQPDHACFEKLRIFHHLPLDVKDILFIDVDVMVLSDFWNENESETDYFARSHKSLVLSKDLFIGYKEKMESEFQIFDPQFYMKYFPDGSYYYFNTGVFFASRDFHSLFFNKCLEDWINYIKITGLYPSIFDQNIFNYCLIKYNIDIELMPIANNCLRQYNPVICDGELLLDGSQIKAMHFNGGDINLKHQRWRNLLVDLEK